MVGPQKWALFISAALGPVAAVQADVIELAATADTYLRGAYGDGIYGSSDRVYIADGEAAADNNKPRGLYKFDISGVGGVVTSATLRLTQSTARYPSTASTFRAFRGTGASSQDWVESQAMWTVYATGQSWTTAGGDYTTDDMATTTSPGTNSQFTFDVTAMTQAARDAGQSFLTIYILGDESSWTNADTIWTKDVANASQHPLLTVDSVIPEPASLALLGMGGMLMWGRGRRGL